MNSIATANLIVSSVTDVGVSFLSILGVLFIVAVGLLVIRWGWKNLRLSAYEAVMESRISMGNRKYAAQLYNSELLSRGDKVGTIDSM